MEKEFMVFPVMPPLSEGDRADIQRLAAELPVSELPKGEWVKALDGSAVYVEESILDISSCFLHGTRGEQPDSSALPTDGALRGDVPLSITEWNEV